MKSGPGVLSATLAFQPVRWEWQMLCGVPSSQQPAVASVSWGSWSGKIEKTDASTTSWPQPFGLHVQTSESKPRGRGLHVLVGGLLGCRSQRCPSRALILHSSTTLGRAQHCYRYAGASSPFQRLCLVSGLTDGGVEFTLHNPNMIGSINKPSHQAN